MNLDNRRPYQEEVVDNKIIRTFLPDVESEELKWHQDLKDRNVRIIKSTGWFFQMEDQLPKRLLDGDQIFIPKLSWHRVIKGNNELIVEIEES